MCKMNYWIRWIIGRVWSHTEHYYLPDNESCNKEAVYKDYKEINHSIALYLLYLLDMKTMGLLYTFL